MGNVNVIKTFLKPTRLHHEGAPGEVAATVRFPWRQGSLQIASFSHTTVCIHNGDIVTMILHIGIDSFHTIVHHVETLIVIWSEDAGDDSMIRSRPAFEVVVHPHQLSLPMALGRNNRSVAFRVPTEEPALMSVEAAPSVGPAHPARSVSI